MHTRNLLQNKTGSELVRMKEIHKVQVLAEKTNPLPFTSSSPEGFSSFESESAL